jgi:transposase
MLKPAYPAQKELEMVTLEQLVPKDHLLRLLDQYIRFDFVREAKQRLYCENNGRPAIDPVVPFKMLFIGYLFRIGSERRLVKEIEVNVAYRWFLDFRLTDKIPDALTLSQNRCRRVAGTDIEQRIFDGIVEHAIAHKLIGGRVLYTDSTHLKANANTRHFEVHQVEQLPEAYLARLDRIRERFDLAVGAVGLDAGYFTPQVRKGILERELFGVMGYKRPNKREGYFYKRCYRYDPEQDSYRCPAGGILLYRTTNRLGYREYVSNPARCLDCAVRRQCTQSRNHQKLVTRYL